MNSHSFKTAKRTLRLLSLLPFSYLVAPAIAFSNPDVLKTSPTSLQARQVQNQYLTLAVQYDYTNLGELDGNIYTEISIGADNQKLRLALDLDGLTWVPQQPNSTTDFCNKKANTAGCRLAGISGYYTPESGVSKKDIFSYTFPEYPDLNATGYWTEDVLTVGGISVNLQFGVATSWNIVPTLGLGLSSFLKLDRPSYIQALQQQGKIAAQYCSCYNITGTGGIVLGGVDLDKFSGKFKIFTGYEQPGIVDSPSIKIFAETNNSNVGQTDLKTALITPGTPFMYLPQDVLDATLKLLPTNYSSDLGVYTLPCDYEVNPDWFYEFDFGGFNVKIPFSELLSPVQEQATGRCFIAALGPSNGYIPGYDFSYVLGGPFLRAVYAVVNPELNLTALALAGKDVTTESIIPLGGSFGTQIADLVGTAPSTSSTPQTPPTESKSQKTSIGAIVGGVVGGIVALIALIGGVFLYRRRRVKSAQPTNNQFTDSQYPPELPAPPGRPMSELHGLDTYKDGTKGVNYHQQTGPTQYAELSPQEVQKTGTMQNRPRTANDKPIELPG